MSWRGARSIRRRRLGAELLVTRSVAQLEPQSREVHLDGGDVVRGRTIILATGVTWRRLAIDGFDRLIGKGIYYGAARSEASATHGLDVHLIGGGNSAGQAALYFANHARSVTIVVRGESLEKSMSHYLIAQLRAKANVAVRARAEVVAALRRHPSGGDRHPRSWGFSGPPARMWRPVRLHRRRCRDRVAAGHDCA